MNIRDSRHQLNSELSQLRVVQIKPDEPITDEIICPNCANSNYNKAGVNPNGKQQYLCKDCKRRFVENPENNKTAESEDVLSATKLGLRVNHHLRTGEQLNFSRIKQVWFKELTIKYVRYQAATRELATLKVCLSAFRSFSEFLLKTGYVQGINDLNRSVIIDYISYLNSKTLIPKT